MLIVTLRTDNPQAELALYQDDQQLTAINWQAHRQLGETLHKQLSGLLEGQSKSWSDLEGLVCFEGPGSFTGLRIGLSVANALAYSFGLPVVGTTGEAWQAEGIKLLQAGKGSSVVMPSYGAAPHITKPRK